MSEQTPSGTPYEVWEIPHTSWDKKESAVTKPKRLTENDLVYIASFLREDGMTETADSLVSTFAALEAELARIGAITMGLTPEPEPTEGIEAKVWEMVLEYIEEIARAVEDRKDAEKELAQRDAEIARLRDELGCNSSEAKQLTELRKNGGWYACGCGGIHQGACPNRPASTIEVSDHGTD